MKNEFNYKKYFNEIKPKNEMDIYNRFIFTFCSIHTTWNSNVKGYNLLKDKYWTNKKELTTVMKTSGLGLNTTRTKGIYDFTKKFMKHPEFYKRKKWEKWDVYEKRIIDNTYFLGLAKGAFVIELLYPNTAKVVCTDVHVLRIAKQPSTASKSIHMKVKRGFMNHAKQHNMNPVEMRWRMWDKIQSQKDSRYWAYVFESPSTTLKYNNMYKQNYELESKYRESK